MLDVDQRCTQTSRATVGTCTCPTRTHALVVSLRRKTPCAAACIRYRSNGWRQRRETRTRWRPRRSRPKKSFSSGRPSSSKTPRLGCSTRKKRKRLFDARDQNKSSWRAGFVSHAAPRCSTQPLTPFSARSHRPSTRCLPRASKKRLATAKEHMFRDSQKLYALRQEEANLIAEICGAQVSMVEMLERLKAKLEFQSTGLSEL